MHSLLSFQETMFTLNDMTKINIKIRFTKNKNDNISFLENNGTVENREQSENPVDDKSSVIILGDLTYQSNTCPDVVCSGFQPLHAFSSYL